MQKLKPKDKFRIVKDDIEYEFEVAEEGGYTASVPDLPGCLSEGDTFEQALGDDPGRDGGLANCRRETR